MLNDIEKGRSGSGMSIGLRICLLLACAGIGSGCTAHKFANPLAALTSATPNHQQVAVGSTAKAPDTHAQPALTSNVRATAAYAPTIRNKTNPDNKYSQLRQDDIVTGSTGKSDAVLGQGKSRIERISNTISPSCRRILAHAGIESTLLRSPTINGSVNSDQDINIGASYDLLDLRRANLKEQLAMVQCARNDAAAKLAQLLVTSNQSLNQAGFQAKAGYLKRARGEIASIKQAISSGLNNGELTVFRANVLRQSIRQLEAEAASAEGEANKRQIVRRIQGKSYFDLDRRLEETETRIQQLESQMRSADALKFKASVGYAQRGDGSDDITISDDGEMTAKIAVSVRLGAYSPQRFELEDIASDARAASLYEVNNGVLWRSLEAARINKIVVGSLQLQRSKVRSALSAARQSAADGAGSARPDRISAHLKGRIEVVRLTAELAALNATLSDTTRLDTKLTFRQ